MANQKTNGGQMIPPPWDDVSDSNSDSDDDWMLSVKKYNHYFSWKMDMDLYIVRVHPDGTKILVTGKHRGENAMDQLIIYALPEKLLTLDPEKEGLIKSRELKLICGHHFLHYRRLTNAEFIPGKRLSLVVQDQNTISLLEPESPDSDLLVETNKIEVNREAKFKIVDEKRAIVSDGVRRVYELNLDNFELHGLNRGEGTEPPIGLSSDGEFLAVLYKMGRCEFFDQGNVRWIVDLMPENHEHVAFMTVPESNGVMQMAALTTPKHLFGYFARFSRNTFYDGGPKPLHTFYRDIDLLKWTSGGKFLLLKSGKSVIICNPLQPTRHHVIHENESKKDIIDVACHPKYDELIFTIDYANQLEAIWFHNHMEAVSV